MSIFRLPQDVHQTAKVSKLLLAVNSGQGHKYKGKTLDEIEFSDTVDSDVDSTTDEEDNAHSSQVVKETKNQTSSTKRSVEPLDQNALDSDDSTSNNESN